MSLPSPEPPAGPSSADTRIRHARAPFTGRLARLTLKEMRETLRDRRTLITLVLMPFLLYPLLSLILRRFMLTGLIAGTVPTYHIAFESEQDAAMVRNFVETGRQILARRSGRETLPEIQFFTTDNVDQPLRNGDIDVGIRVTRPPPQEVNPRQSWEMDCELIFLEGSHGGEPAARHIDDCLRATGSVLVSERLGAAGINQRPSPIRPQWRKIASPKKSSFVELSALIPFVLILMTITGAVYPAIDLTAGERERGTLELLVATPVPRLGLLFAKYIAVLTVAMLTGSVNLLAMTATVTFSGLGPVLWGEKGVSIGTVAAVFCLLFLLASFFSAVLLAITSFARSFKEAQAYLIPVMLFALGPSVISLMPGVQLNSWLVVVPLLNVALLARDVLQGTASLWLGVIVVASTGLYAFAALAVAAKLFATDAVLSDARIGWAELWRRTPQTRSAGIAVAFLCLAYMFPLSFSANGAIAVLSDWPMSWKLIAMAAATAIVFGAVPLVFVYWRRIPWQTGMQWRWPPAASWLGAAILGVSMWPFAHEVTVATQAAGLATLDEEQFERVRGLVEQVRTAPFAFVLLAFALSPAIFEELCFRGFVFSAFRSRLRPWPAILASGFLFGLFHLVATDALAVERFVPSTLLGLALGWVCYRTASVFPGMVVHACHNGFLAVTVYYLPELKARGWGLEEEFHLPWIWLAVAALGVVIGVGTIYFSSRVPRPEPPQA